MKLLIKYCIIYYIIIYHSLDYTSLLSRILDFLATLCDVFDFTFNSQTSHLLNILLKLLVTLVERRSLLNDWECDIEEDGDEGNSDAAGSDDVGGDDVVVVGGHETITIGDTQTYNLKLLEFLSQSLKFNISKS